MPPSKLIVKHIFPPKVFFIRGVILKGGEIIYIYIYIFSLCNPGHSTGQSTLIVQFSLCSPDLV